MLRDNIQRGFCKAVEVLASEPRKENPAVLPADGVLS
jgi:hypothetical protein